MTDYYNVKQQLKIWGKWCRQDRAPTGLAKSRFWHDLYRAPRSTAEDRINHDYVVLDYQAWPTELAVRRLDKPLQLVLGCRYIARFSFYEPRVQKFFSASHMALYRRLDKAHALIKNHLDL